MDSGDSSLMRQQIGKHLVDPKDLWSVFIMSHDCLPAPDFHQQTCGKVQCLRGNPEAKTPWQNSHQTLSQEVQETGVIGFQHHGEILGIRVSFFPLLLVIFLGKPLESLEIQHYVFSSRCEYALVTSQLFTQTCCFWEWSLQFSRPLTHRQTHPQS